ncbi:MAG TPA: DUF2892 domain-containing protein [Alphaproteobacteria bacterium]|nr:DUF2892 domain-containing protein [Alphaproteobacteria bacterium]
MSSNVGGVDRVLRFLVGLAVLSAIFWYPGEARWFGLIGLVPLTTALFRFCPLYSIFGISSCPRG